MELQAGRPARRIARPDAFPGLDKADFGQHLFRRRTHDVAANWKLVMDAFLESYHVQRLHGATIGPFFRDGVSAADRLGPHQRSAVGRAAAPERCAADDWPTLRGAITCTCQMFPGTVPIVSPDDMNLMVPMPQFEGRVLVENLMLIPEAPGEREGGRIGRRAGRCSTAASCGRGFPRGGTRAAGAGIGAIERLTLGTLETGIRHVHDAVEALLQARADAPATTVRSRTG